MKTIIEKIIICTTICFTLFFACSPTMNFTVMRPAELNLSEYKTVAIGEFVNEHGQTTSRAKNIEDAIVQNLFDGKAFEVLDRQHINRILDEQKLGHSGLVDESTAAELGKIIGSGVMVFGRIQKEDYKEETSRSDHTDREGNRYYIHRRTGTMSLDVNLRIIDVNTGRIVAARTLNSAASNTTSQRNGVAPAINKDALYTSCVRQIQGRFGRMVAPYPVSVSVSFEKDRNLPELDQALLEIRMGEWDAGLEILEQSANRDDLEPKVKAKALYNFGVMSIYAGNYDEAIDILMQANRLSPKSKYQTALSRARREKREAERLQEQQM